LWKAILAQNCFRRKTGVLAQCQCASRGGRRRRRVCIEREEESVHRYAYLSERVLHRKAQQRLALSRARLRNLIAWRLGRRLVR
jgi:hypothetical protein